MRTAAAGSRVHAQDPVLPILTLPGAVLAGDWGAPAFSGAVNLTEGFAEPMSIHTSDEMSNPISEEFMMFYGITGIPTLKVWNSENSFSDSTGIAGAVVAELAEEPLAEASALVVMTDMGNSYELGVFHSV